METEVKHEVQTETEGTENENTETTLDSQIQALKEVHEEDTKKLDDLSKQVSELTKQNAKLLLRMGLEEQTDEDLFNIFNKYKRR